MRWSCFVLVLVFACAAKPPSPEAEEPVPLGRLPADVRPSRCALSLELDPRRDRFSGSAEIALTLRKARSVLWLNGRGLQVSGVSFELPSGERVSARWQQVDEIGVAKVVPAKELPAGTAVLRLAWEAPFDPQLVGVYRTRAGGRAYAFSKFEAIYARRAFPGFDEPDVKVPYAVTLTVPSDLVALSNAPQLGEEPAGPGMKRVRFRETPPLPTYLVAFAAGQFDLVDAPVPPNDVRDRSLPLRGVAVPGNASKLNVALREAAAAIVELEHEFALPFPYEKVDLIAIPDFQSGAMENAGAITFRDQLLLLNEATASLAQRKRVADTVAHELAHQWFGDLVTMEWWDNLWLNEGFATFIATRVLERTHPELHVELDEVRSSGGVMSLDELVSTRKIRQPILSSHDITNAFDGITYQKGAAILRMFQRWAGVEKFREGLRNDLRAHLHGSATTADLLGAVSAAAGKDLSGPFQSFLDQPGVPLIEARVSCREGQGSVSLRQSRALPLGSKGPRDALWQVPVCVRAAVAGRVEESCTLLGQREGELPLRGCPDWIFPNADAAGYYRWTLGAADLQALREKGYPALSAAERISLAQGLRSAFNNGVLPAKDVLPALRPLAADPNGSVAAQPMGIFTLIHDEMADATWRPRVEEEGRGLYAPTLARLGWQAAQGEPSERRELREHVIRFLALEMDDAVVRAEAARRGRAWLGGARDAVDRDLVPVALGAAAVEGGAAFFDEAQARLFASEEAELRERLLKALSLVSDPALSARALQLSFDDRLRQNERAAPLFTQLGRVQTRDRAWDFLEQHFDALAPRLPDRFAGFLVGALEFCDEDHARRIQAFFAPRIERIEGGPRKLASTLERIDLCIARVRAQGPGARDYFAAR